MVGTFRFAHPANLLFLPCGMHCQVIARSQPPQRLQNSLRLREQIAKEHHQAPMLEHGGDLVEAAGDVGLAGRLEIRQQRKHVPELMSVDPPTPRPIGSEMVGTPVVNVSPLPR